MSHQFDPNQYTIKKSVSCCGVGLHSGRTVNLTIKPAPVNNGIRFFRTDMLDNNNYVNAHMDKVVSTTLATTIGSDSFQISTTEHLMAAIKVFGIDNADIELDASEVPIMDGSAGPFYTLIKKSGKKKQDGYRKALRITKPITFTDGDKVISIAPYDGFRVTGKIEFEDTLIQTQEFCFDLNDDFESDVAKARTFGYVEQVEELWANGLALGGTLENVIAIHWNRKSVLNEDGLRYEDEFIRHKVLDLVGDLALLGCPILGEVTAYKSGHTQHLGLMQAIANSPECWEVIELKDDGEHSVLHNIVTGTKAAAHELLMPFLAPVNPVLA